jgi:hypothetical protein
VATLAAAIDLQEQLLAWETELESRKGAITMREVGLVAFEHALRRVHLKHDASRVQAKAT